ncbi:hypothetical protein [Nocardia tengchongensis]|uniref:hypothetical protein n=1 Tax=Nocardia tengchongensis TaxID=2055889 RepID=UPI0036827904
MTIRLMRPVRGISVRSTKTPGNCAPDRGYVEVDFEPLAEGELCSVEFAPGLCAEQEFLTALEEGALIELAGAGVHDPDRRQGKPVLARMVVRGVEQHEVDSCAAVFRGLGVLAVREMLDCVAEGRVAKPVVTKVEIGYRP